MFRGAPHLKTFQYQSQQQGTSQVPKERSLRIRSRMESPGISRGRSRNGMRKINTGAQLMAQSHQRPSKRPPEMTASPDSPLERKKRFFIGQHVSSWRTSFLYFWATENPKTGGAVSHRVTVKLLQHITVMEFNTPSSK